jgi:DNA-binding transcriptional LysR family regulator
MRRLNLDQLHALVEVVRLGSFSAAARVLNLTQPAVSLQVRELELRLGLELIERLGKQAFATAAGAELIDRAARIETEVNDALDAMRRHRDGWLGRVRIGTGAAIVTYLLPPLLRTLRRTHPDIELVINSGTTERIVERLSRNEVDVGLVTLPVQDRSLVVQPIREDAMLAVLPPSEVDAPALIDAAALARHPLILDAVGAQMHELARAWFRAAGVDARPAMELDGVVAIRNIVSAGLGVTILPVEALLGESAAAPVVLRGLAPPLTRTLALVRRADKTVGPALAYVEAALMTLRDVRIRLPHAAKRAPRRTATRARDRRLRA